MESINEIEDCQSIDYITNVKDLTATLENIASSKCKILKIQKCSSTSQASKLISESQFRSAVFTKFPSLIAISLCIEGTFEEEKVYQPRNHEFQNKERFVVSFSSTENDHTIIYWKNDSSYEFMKLSLSNGSTSAAINQFAFDFIVKTLTNNNSITPLESSDVHLTNIIDESGADLLSRACDNGNLPLVKELLRHPFDVNRELYDGSHYCKLIDFIWEDENYDILIELLRANSMYPVKFNESIASYKIKKFLKISTNLHAAIKSNNQIEVEEIINKNSGLRYYFNENNESAAKVALKCQNFEIYAILAENDVTFGPDEVIENRQDEDFREKICQLNADLAKNLPKHHIMQLLSKCVVPRSDLKINQRLKVIKNAFETLDSIQELSPALHILASDKQTKFHFDFNQFSTIYMDPTLRQGTGGFFNSRNNHLYIAAKGLLNDKTKNDTLGIISHESHHSCFNLVFKNVRLPFPIDDDDNEDFFLEIIDECFKLKHHESIIESVYDYPKNAWGRELAVRVPHIIAYYNDNQEKLKELKIKFKSLFDFHEQVVMPAIISAVPIFEKLADKSNEISFSDLSGSLKTAILHSKLDFQGSEVKILQIVNDSSSITLNSLKSYQISEILEGKVIKICNFKMPTVDIYTERSFLEISKKKKALNCESIIAEMAKSKTFLLSDQAGTGKSTTLQYLSKKFKAKNPENLIALVDLKQYLHVYEKFNNIENEILNLDQILDVLKEIFAFTDSLEIAITQEYIKSGKIILLLDGVDEIAPKFKDFFIKFAVGIKTLSKIQQYITTRPHHSEELSKQIDSKVYSFKSFNDEQLTQFIYEIMIFKKVESPLAATEDITSMCTSLKSIDNPLMLRMLCELHVAGNLNLKSMNRFTLYNKMVELKKNILAKEKGEISYRDMIVDSKITHFEIHQVFALKSFFYKTKNFDISELQLIKKWEKEKLNWSNEAVSRLGFLSVDNWDQKPEFVHRTFEEYFLASFLIDITKEVMEASDGEISEKEFDVRMKMIMFLIDSSFNSSLELSDVTINFLSDYLLDLQNQKMSISQKFLNFAEKSCDQVLAKASLSNDCRVVFISLATKLFKILYLNEKLNNSNKILFNFKQKLNSLALKALSDNFTNDSLSKFIVNLTELFNLNDKSYINHCFIVQSKSQEEQDLEIFNFFFSKTLLNDLSNFDRKIYMKSFVKYFSILTLKNRSMTEILIKICTKHCNNLFAEDIRLNFSSSVIYSTMLPIRKFKDEIHDNLSFYFTKTEKMLKFDRGFLRRALPSSDLLIMTNNPRDKYFIPFCIMQNEITRNYYMRYFTTDEIQKYFLSELPTVFKNSTFSVDDVKTLDSFIKDVFALSSSLELFIFNFEKLSDVLIMCEIFIDSFGENEWEDYIKYSVTQPNYSSEVLSVRELKQFALEIYEICQHNNTLPSNYQDNFKNFQTDFFVPYKLLSLFISRDIPDTKVHKFIILNFKTLLEFFTQTFDLNENYHIKLLPIIHKFFDCLNCYYQIPHSLSSLSDIIQKEIFKLTKIRLNTPVLFLDCFYENLNKSINNNTELLSRFIPIDRNEQSIQLFVIAINFNCQNIINVYKKCLTRSMQLNIFIQNLVPSKVLIDPINVENFKKFLKIFFDITNFESIENQSFSDFVHKHNYEIATCRYDNSKRKAEIVFLLLNCILQSKMTINDVENFLVSNISVICKFSFFSCSLLSKIFEIFRKYFQNSKLRVAKIVKLTSAEIFNPLKVTYQDAFSRTSIIEMLWLGVEEFLNDNTEAMGEVFLSKYKNENHPLIIAISFDMKILQNMYFDRFSCQEVLDIFLNEMFSISNVTGLKKIKNFFHTHFLSIPLRKIELRNFLENNQRRMFNMIDRELECISHTNSDIAQTRRNNLYQFRSCLNEILKKVDLKNEKDGQSCNLM